MTDFSSSWSLSIPARTGKTRPTTVITRKTVRNNASSGSGWLSSLSSAMRSSFSPRADERTPEIELKTEVSEDVGLEDGSMTGRESEKERLLASSPVTGSGSHSTDEKEKPGGVPSRMLLSGSTSGDDSMKSKAIRLVGCFLGLQASYIIWGLVQERMVTKAYGEGADAEFFPSSAFLVFGNRALALVVSATIVYWPWSNRSNTDAVVPQGLKAPLWQYAPASLSNILSSWAQYEALKYVSFPTQVLSKSSKIIPVMLVGRLLHRRSYSWAEYVDAALITLGVTIFSLNEKKPKAGHDGGADSTLGYILLAMYLMCDSFTSQWQDKVFKKFHVSQFQMMLGVNLCSIIFTGASLLQTGQGASSLAFMIRHPDAAQHVFILSLCSASGQLFIFYTIKQFGAIVFTIMMTIRQMLSMILSCALFAHPLAWQSFIGALLCFGTIALRIKRNLQWKQRATSGTGS